MLKQLIQLFAEKFLQNKREAIQAWNYPTNTGTRLQLVAGKDYDFVPPANGFIQVVLRENSQGFGFSALTQRGGNSEECPRVNASNLSGWYATFIPVQKGVGIKLSPTVFSSTSRCVFLPNQA
jgi:hypothetical protein